MRRIAGVLALLLTSCVTAVAPSSSPIGPWPVLELERWNVHAGDRLVGRLLLLEVQDQRSPVQMYQVQNAAGQWLGYVDAQGRVYQRVPFDMTERFRGIHSMEKGLALLYEESGPLRLARDVEAVDAVATR
jgi:hypothetical protein